MPQSPGMGSILRDFAQAPKTPDTRKAMRDRLREWERVQVQLGLLPVGASFFHLREDRRTGYTTINRQTPAWTHNCGSCAFLGTWEAWDLYVCRSTEPGHDRLLARHSSEPFDYVYEPLEHTPQEHEALRVAFARLNHLDDPAVPEEIETRDDPLLDPTEDLVDQLKSQAALKGYTVILQSANGSGWVARWGRGEESTTLGRGPTLRAAVLEALRTADLRHA